MMRGKRFRLLPLVIGMGVLSVTSGTQAARADQPTRPAVLVAVQMEVRLEDYQSPEAFDAAVQRYMKAAMRTKGDGPRMVAFPEDVGLGLVFMDDYELVKDCSSIFEAAYVMMNTYWPEIYQICGQYGCSPTRGLLLLKGDRVSQVYSDTFSRAAKEHHATVVAGSAPLPGPDGSVYATSLVFGPTGKLIGSQRKVHLVDLEGPYGLDLSAGALEDIHPMDTPVGRVGVGICYDMFFPDVVDKLVDEGSEILVQPSFNPHVWDEWQIEDWKNGLWTAVATHPSVIAGVNPMAVGGLWEIAVEGVSSVIGGPFEPPADGYLAEASSATDPDIVAAELRVHR
ncbi:MAG: carbon-nitrogen hydrolase family protein [Armatimonadota bacterium]